MNIKASFITAILLFFCSCNQKQKQTRPNIFAPKVVKAEGYIVPKDSMAIPEVVPAGKPKVFSADKPTVVPVKTNMYLAGIPRTVIAGKPKICTPGEGSFSLPKVVPAIIKPFLAGTPEVVIAGDAASKEQNAQSFSSFTKQEGLKANAILSMFQDKNGNIWFGTWGGGVSRYDGKYFTHFTEKEGLSDNSVYSIYEDRAGNLWFGTQWGGVSKYDGKYFTNFTEKEGLSNNVVGYILEDRSGNIWFGTESGGVSRLDRDGKNFTHFTEKEGLGNNNVRSIFEDISGNLWFGTGGGGVSKYDGNSFTNYTEKEGLSNNFITSILKDRSGNLWFGTGGGGVSRLDRDGRSFTHYTEKEGLCNNNVSEILEDKAGNFWFSTWGGGISRLDRDGKTFTNFTEEDGLANNKVNCILEDRSGGLWFGTDRGGVSKYNGRTFTHFTRKEGLSTSDVESIFEDRSGNLWFGTNGKGVSKYNGKTFTNFTEKEGFINNEVASIFQDRSGNLWFGTWGAGVFKYDDISFTHFTVKEGLCSDEVTKILQDKTGNIWVSTGGSGGGVSRLDRDGKTFTRYTDKEGLSNNDVWSIFEDKSGNLWFGTNRGISRLDRYGKTFTHFTVKEGLSGKVIWAIIEDTSGSLWIGTDGGVSRLDRDGKTFTHFTEKEGLINNVVKSILQDRSGNIWFGTDFGLSKLSPKSLLKLSADAIPIAIGTADKSGFPDPTNNDQAGEVLFKSYTYADGFLGTPCNTGAIFEDKNGTIWIGTEDRLTAYHPEGDIRDTIPPNIQLTGIALFNEAIPWANLDQKKDTGIVLGNGVHVGNFKFDSLSRWYNIPAHLSLAYNNNFLTFNFIGITTKSPKGVKYQYKLEGLDENWSALTNRNEAVYGNLPPDNYTFKVKAMNSEEYWSSELDYSFTIRPPWWQTWWFRAMAALCVAALFYGSVRWSIHRKFRLQLERSGKEKQIAELGQKTAELQQQKTEMEMQALRAQMNPHFIFNSLNSINRFILQNNRLQASEYLTKFSKLVRMILQNSQHSLITLESELDSLEIYMNLEQVRFDHHFDYKISVPKDLDVEVLKVPPLFIQPYVENAIWHGLMHKEEKGKLDVEVSQEEDFLYFKITDNGIGRKKAAEIAGKSASKHKSMGLKITADRIAMMQQTNGDDSPVHINDLVNPDGTAAGTEVVIKMPVIEE